MAEVKSASTYEGKINCDALCFCLQFLLLSDAGWALWGAYSASLSLQSLVTIAIVIKAALMLTSVFALCWWRPQVWAFAVTGTSLYGIVVPLSLVDGAIRMSASRSSISALFAQASYVGAAIIFVVLASLACLFWKSYRAFDVPLRHRWRLLVRVGLPVSLTLFAIDVYRLFIDTTHA